MERQAGGQELSNHPGEHDEARAEAGAEQRAQGAVHGVE